MFHRELHKVEELLSDMPYEQVLNIASPIFIYMLERVLPFVKQKKFPLQYNAIISVIELWKRKDIKSKKWCKDAKVLAQVSADARDEIWANKKARDFDASRGSACWSADVSYLAAKFGKRVSIIDAIDAFIRASVNVWGEKNLIPKVEHILDDLHRYILTLQTGGN